MIILNIKKLYITVFDIYFQDKETTQAQQSLRKRNHCITIGNCILHLARRAYEDQVTKLIYTISSLRLYSHRCF